MTIVELREIITLSFNWGSLTKLLCFGCTVVLACVHIITESFLPNLLLRLEDLGVSLGCGKKRKKPFIPYRSKSVLGSWCSLRALTERGILQKKTVCYLFTNRAGPGHKLWHFPTRGWDAVSDVISSVFAVVLTFLYVLTCSRGCTGSIARCYLLIWGR